ncbi:TPA: hypothetical protein SMF29_002222 [Serratia marcescens]|nr:hypothetical protein [Serratia marcescens]
MDNITQFREYIDYYKKLTAPGYAVLVTGEWGSGKTYQIKKTLHDDEMYYVSLFDITSIDDIYASVFYKMSPAKAVAKKAAEDLSDASIGTGAFTFGLGGIVSGLVNAVIKEDVKNDRVIVFDDIERCSVNINQILGAINKYVEHHGCKVVAIAHDKKIMDSFEKSKEKVIGQTLRVEPDINEVFNFFTDGKIIPDKIKEATLNAFIASECRSMRILKHSINDCVRLLECLESKHIESDVAMHEIFTFFMVFSIEYRYGNLKESDIELRLEKSIKYHVNKSKENEEPPAIEKISESYRKKGLTIDLTASMLSDKTLINCLTKGYYEKNKIIFEIESSKYFSQANMDSWLILMNFDGLQQQDVKLAIQDIDEKLENHSIVDIGVILHIFNLKLLMSLINAHSLTYREVYTQLNNYLGELLKRDLIPFPNPNSRFSMFRDSSHGYGYWIRDEYRNISNDMFDLIEYYQKIAIRRKYPDYIKEIIDTMSNEPDKFKRLVSSGYHGLGQYSYIDVMRYIKAHQFVEIWLDAPVSNWQKIREGLQERYSTGALHNQLSEEKLWIKRVNYILRTHAEKKTGFDRLRIERLTCKID